MNNGNVCINGAEIATLLWKIGSNPWITNYITPFTQGDQATALLKVELNDCDSFEGLTLDAFVQVPNPDQDIVKIHATIDSDNKAIFTLPDELLWWPGGYTVNFMFTDGGKVNYSNIVNNAYTVNSNPALAGEDPPTILPGDVAVYEQLIADLNAENTRAETNLPLLEAENERAEQNIADAEAINTELEGTISDAETAKTDLEGTISDSETAKANLEQTITDSETAKTNLEGTIADAGQAQSDLQEKIDEVPGLIQDITDEGNTQVDRVEAEGDTQENRIINQGNTQVDRVETEGDTQFERVETEGNAQVTRVNNQGTIEVNRVSSEGTTQVIRVGNKGDEEYQRLNDLIQTSPEGGNAMLLDGRTRTSFEEDIESRQYALDSRLVYAFEPHKRNIENLEHGVYVKNPLTNGDGTIKSEDADSMAGVFNDDDKNFYCGEGYENLTLPLGSTQGSPIQEYDNLILRIELTSTGVNTYSQLHYTQFLSGNNYSVSWEIIEDTNNIFQQISMHGLSFVTSESSIDIKGSMSGECNVSANANGISLLINGNVGEFITVKIQVTETSQPVPFVKATAPDGKLIIKEPWITPDYTIINLDENYQEQEFFIDSTGINFHLKNDGVTRNNYVSFSGAYEGFFSQNEIDNEILKVSSGQYYVPNTGVYEPVQGAKIRYNEYGQAKNFVYITDTNTDIQLVEESKRVYTEDTTGAMFVDLIDASGIITGAGKIVDVDGYIRTTEGNLKVRIEKEQL